MQIICLCIGAIPYIVENVNCLHQLVYTQVCVSAYAHVCWRLPLAWRDLVAALTQGCISKENEATPSSHPTPSTDGRGGGAPMPSGTMPKASSCRAGSMPKQLGSWRLQQQPLGALACGNCPELAATNWGRLYPTKVHAHLLKEMLKGPKWLRLNWVRFPQWG